MMTLTTLAIFLVFLQTSHSVLGLESLVSRALSCYSNPQDDGSCPYEDITFWLYTRSLPNGAQITPDNLETLPVEEKAPWKIIFHGLNSRRTEPPAVNLVPAYFHRGPYNLLVLDYAAPFMYNKTYLCYPWAATKSLDLVADCSTKFILRMIESKVLPRLEDLHVIGHSLGCHTAAKVCNQLNEEGIGKVGRLTGLDPAGPLFHTNFTSAMRLMGPGDASFVDAYHSNGGDRLLQFGTKENRGDVDVRFNGGGLQPGCGTDITCNHQRAVDYFAESISPIAPDYHRFLAKHENSSERILVGEDISLDVRGVLYVTTNEESPFAQD